MLITSVIRLFIFFYIKYEHSITLNHQTFKIGCCIL